MGSDFCKKSRSKRYAACSDVAEMEGFEPPHTLRCLSDFESEPFSHLGTSPYSLCVDTILTYFLLYRKEFCCILRTFYSHEEITVDTLYFNGTVRTMTAMAPEEALLVRDGRVLRAGDFAPLLKECTYTAKVDLQGGCLLPAVFSPRARSPVPRQTITLNTCPGEEPALSPRELLRQVREAADGGYQLAVRCFTDGAIDRLLAALEKGKYPAALRPLILGGEMMEKDQLVLAKKLGAAVVFSLGDLYPRGDSLLKALGDRAHTLWPCWSALRREVPFTLSGEEEAPGLETVFSAAVRRTSSGVQLGRGERVSVYEALQAVTVDLAWTHHLERECGTLAPGMRADLVILDRDPLEVDEEDPPPIRLLQAVQEGKTLWRGPSE